MIIFAVLFLIEGCIGIGMWLCGAPFWSASGPVIVQGFGCAAAVGISLWGAYAAYKE